jgi:hypothetical protein
MRVLLFRSTVRRGETYLSDYCLLNCLSPLSAQLQLTKERRTGTNASDRQLPIDAYGPKKMLQVCAAASPRNNS